VATLEETLENPKKKMLFPSALTQNNQTLNKELLC
jgi:hypothetical protein